MLWYRKRGDASENRIKDLKIGFGIERMPCGDFTANAVFFRIGVLAYNLLKYWPCQKHGVAIRFKPSGGVYIRSQAR